MEKLQFYQMFGYGSKFDLKKVAEFKNELTEEELISAIKTWYNNELNHTKEMDERWPQKAIDEMGYY